MPMTYLERRVPLVRAIALLCACAALMAFAAAATLRVEPSGAGCSGTGCLPVGNYTLDTNYNCGQIVWEACYANGTTSAGSAVQHHYGWGSAAYNGAGSINVGFAAVNGGTAYFAGFGTNLARGCYYASCVPQGATNLKFYVYQVSGVAHTVWGHAKA